MERGRGQLSATQEIEREFGIPVIAIATLDDLLRFIDERADLEPHRTAIEEYRRQYGVETNVSAR
jgi:orotate phosphoribosyltransferase